MKVLLVTRPICPPWDEASKNFAYDLACNIKDAEIHLLTYEKLSDLPTNIIQEDIYSEAGLNLNQKYRLYKFLKKADGFDIIHSLFTPTKLNSFLLKRALRNKPAKIIQTAATLREDLYSKNDFKKMLFGELIITYSDYAKEKLEKMGFNSIKRIYPGIDTLKYSPAPKNFELAKRFNIDNGDFVINFPGEYTRLGAIDDVIETFANLISERKNLKLLLACRVKNEKDLQKKKEIVGRLKEKNILGRAAFADDRNYKMEDIYNLSEIIIFPARDMRGKFDIPLAIIEAMACRKPVIASNIKRLKCFLNNTNSILINTGDRKALKEKILYLHSNHEARKNLGEKGMQFAIENFDVRKIAKEYKEVYRNLTSSSPFIREEKINK